mmetsp:Transcript_26541/g.44090  ORF Transcript_26541/g.44090 Transcript_26541/m.44090 type:complete len:143 (-) Transcript_26541:69-497(-)
MPEDEIAMNGWLLKRHAHDRRSSLFSKQWAKRFVIINQHRGTLSVSKGERSKPTTILPLRDILLPEIKDLDWGDGSFQIACPPLHLILRATDNAEREVWMRVLREQTAEWQSNARLADTASKSGVPIAVASQYASMELALNT